MACPARARGRRRDEVRRQGALLLYELPAGRGLRLRGRAMSDRVGRPRRRHPLSAAAALAFPLSAAARAVMALALWQSARRASAFAEAPVLDAMRIALRARSGGLGRATVQPGDDAAFQGHTQRAAAPFDQAVLDETLDPFEGRGRIAARPAHNSSQRVQIAALSREPRAIA